MPIISSDYQVYILLVFRSNHLICAFWWHIPIATSVDKGVDLREGSQYATLSGGGSDNARSTFLSCQMLAATDGRDNMGYGQHQ